MMASETPAATPATRPYLRPASSVINPTRRPNVRAGASRSPRSDVKVDRVATAQDVDLEGLAQGRGDSQEPPAERWVLGVVAKHAVHDGPVEEPEAPEPDRGHIGSPRPHVQGLVYRDPGIGNRHEDREERDSAQDQGQSGPRSTIPRLDVSSIPASMESRTSLIRPEDDGPARSARSDYGPRTEPRCEGIVPGAVRTRREGRRLPPGRAVSTR